MSSTRRKIVGIISIAPLIGVGISSTFAGQTVTLTKKIEKKIVLLEPAYKIKVKDISPNIIAIPRKTKIGNSYQKPIPALTNYLLSYCSNDIQQRINAREKYLGRSLNKKEIKELSQKIDIEKVPTYVFYQIIKRNDGEVVVPVGMKARGSKNIEGSLPITLKQNKGIWIRGKPDKVFNGWIFTLGPISNESQQIIERTAVSPNSPYDLWPKLEFNFPLVGEKK